METVLSEQQVKDLVEAAKEARKYAYAPYSRFKVGAALFGTNDEIYVGCNVENGSFGLTLCAERAAVAHAITHGCRDFRALAIVGETKDGPVTPCGACRQVLAEFNPFLTVICASEAGLTRTWPLNELLPHHFDFGLH